MFKRLNKQGVRSIENGCVLQRMDRYCYHYEEDSHIMKIIVEPGIKAEELFFGPDSRWDPPHHNVAISTAELGRIRKNLADALSFMGIAHKFSI